MQYMPKHMQIGKMPLILSYFITRRARIIFTSKLSSGLNVAFAMPYATFKLIYQKLSCAEWVKTMNFVPKDKRVYG